MSGAGANEGMGKGTVFDIQGTIRYNYVPSKDCVNCNSNEEICLKCGKCGRTFDGQGCCVNFKDEIKPKTGGCE